MICKPVSSVPLKTKGAVSVVPLTVGVTCNVTVKVLAASGLELKVYSPKFWVDVSRMSGVEPSAMPALEEGVWVKLGPPVLIGNDGPKPTVGAVVLKVMASARPKGAQ